MNRYLVEWYKKSMIVYDAQPFGPYNFNVGAETIEKAALIAAGEVARAGFSSMYNDAWNATVLGPKDEKYEILKDGDWLIDFKTGKKISELEEKASQN